MEIGLEKFEDSASFVAKLRRKRRKMEVPHQVEIKRHEHHCEVRIFADSGRILRPLLVVRNLKKIKEVKGDYTFQILLDNGVIELIGPEEEEDCQTAWGIRYLFTTEKARKPVKYTHCELDCSFLLALSCGVIPFTTVGSVSQWKIRGPYCRFCEPVEDVVRSTSHMERSFSVRSCSVWESLSSLIPSCAEAT